MKRLRAALPLLLLLALGLAVLASGLLSRFDLAHLAQEEAPWRMAVRAHPILAALAHVAAMALAVATCVPGAVLIVFAGSVLFGAWAGSLLSTTGTLIGATLLFLASRRAFERGDAAEPPLAARLRAGYRSHPLSTTLFLRLVPLFPFGATSVALAWLGCPLWRFLGASAFGSAVMIGLQSALAAGLMASFAQDGAVTPGLLAHPRILWPALGMAALALLPVGLEWIRRPR